MTSQNNKKLAVFFDGTWNTADQHSKEGLPCPTNVSKMFEATLTYDNLNNHQIVHYVRGVGTRKSERITGGGFGYGISDNIKEGYRFLVSNYEHGDEIYIFGFSRGAYTARSLAGLIRNVGIIKREKLYKINEAYKRYKDKSPGWHPNGEDAISFKHDHTWGNEKIGFLGVFDTVGALGAPFGIVLTWIVNKLFQCTFHDTKLSSIIQSAYHALAIDERRLPFLPTLMDPNKMHDSSNFEQKWFPGVHSNVGGGYSDIGLSDLALEWMAGKAMHHGLNIDLKKISNQIFHPDIEEAPKISQTLMYKFASIFFVKLPGTIGLVPKRHKIAYPNILWNGDYLRPVPDKGDVRPFIGNPPKKKVNTYRGSLHNCVIDKINKCWDEYHPANVY